MYTDANTYSLLIFYFCACSFVPSISGCVLLYLLFLGVFFCTFYFLLVLLLSHALMYCVILILTIIILNININNHCIEYKY